MAVQLSQARTCQNHLLSKLSEEEMKPILPMLEIVQGKVGEVLVRQVKSIEYVYFPCDGAYSCMVYMAEGAGIEVGTCGNESFTSIELLLGATLAVETVICQIAGHSLRMKVDDFRLTADHHLPFRKLLQCSAQGYLAQVSQSVACNRLHQVDTRFALALDYP